MQVFTSIIVLAIVFVAFIAADIRDYKERKENAMISLAHVIGISCVSAFDFNDNDAAKDILAQMQRSAPDIMHAWITDKDGKLFATYDKEGGPASQGLYDLRDQKSETHGSQLYVSDKIIDKNRFLGKITLQVEMSELAAIKNARYQMSLILIAVAIGLSFLIAFMVQPYISTRLLNLVNTMQVVQKTGQYDLPVIDNGRDEISTLSQAFNKLMLQVKDSQERKDEFIGIASHELKTPLTSIKGYLDLLQGMENKQPNKLIVQRALESMHKMENLIRDLLDVSRIQSGQLRLNMTQCKIGDVITSSVNSLQMLHASHTISWKNDLNGEMMTADPLRIEQVMTNLISNAIKYSPGEYSVIVSAEKNNEELKVKVRDYGSGIPSEELPYVFERFYRTRNSSVHIAGFGLGLYICRDIIRRHDGKIWAEKESKGTSFYFSLPIKMQ
jgi:signal transduction histidine kinase